jgi:Protein of unknown function (DUF2794)
VSDSEPIAFRPRSGAARDRSISHISPAPPPASPVTAFDRRELAQILAVYGRQVAAGEWRDYALDFGRDSAVFSVFRRTTEWPLYRIEKTPKHARKQGAYSVVTATGLIVKRGHELARVLEVFEGKRLRLVKA